MTTPTRRALVVGAHPDDIEFGAAGTVARWVDEGWDVRYVIATRGQRGVSHVDRDPEEVGAVRDAEARQAAAICGVTDVTFLDHFDSEVVYGRDLLRDLAREFRRHRPHRLVVADPQLLPTDRFVNHPDHRAVATAMLDVVVTGGTTAAIFPELARDEGLQPWRGLEDIWVMGPAGGDRVVDITATVDRKIAAIKAHATQVGGWQTLDDDLRARLAERGRRHGLDYAESFRVIDRG
ncbi:MAG: PIG-L family deacetylase [Actinobacteria bacterium]|nr:PIG-L family deacetylase [Actinomycetota bacterium]